MVYKRLFTGLFICLFSFLLMSHNTSALQPVINLNNYELKYTYSQRQDCGYTNSSLNTTYTYFCYLSSNSDILSRVSSNNTFSLQKGDIIQFYLIVSSPVNTPAAIVYNDHIQPDNSVSSALLVDIELIDNSSFHNYFDNSIIPSGYYLNKIFKITLLQIRDQTSSIGLGSGNSPLYNVSIDGGFPSDYSVAVSLRQGQIWRFVGSDENKEQAEATQDAADNSSTTGSSASSQSQQATSSLLSTITGFFNAIIGVNPSNCKFNSNLPFLPGNGEIDLCSISTPPIVQTLSSLVLVGLFIPFCIHMFNRFVSITESFQR